MTIAWEAAASQPSDTLPNPVLESSEFIAQHSSQVSIPPEGIRKAAHHIYEQLLRQRYSCQTWKSHPLNPQHNEPATVDWIFLVDTLNFCFWSDGAVDHDPEHNRAEPFTVDFQGTAYQGYWALCAAINRALGEGFPCTSATFMVEATNDTWAHIFRSTTATPIPQWPTRLRIIREAGRILLDQCGGSIRHILAAEGERGSNTKGHPPPVDAVAFIKLIADRFPSYRDTATFHGRPVCLYKRAQILVADLWACFEGQGYGHFANIDAITMFADYRVPQALVYVGALAYSDELLALLRAPKARLAPGSPPEVEIRGNSIWAVELICREIRQIIKQKAAEKDLNDNMAGTSSPVINPILVDFYLWDMAKASPSEMAHIPIHRTGGYFY
ncbi:hypothetical protein H4R33_003478 [Dimargaris cristalligena]|uniref:Queuosine 5'-phosphate N-glycosylase/hydrolase n=1 Tax=Dimargaris cristalligena TaxID=215637 RepID=A0A4P9ZYX1_9FUNG|nr:hypothetical protein H4R33_003478 [Dimargaris cristalligena]RKP38946.1 hypothetical protein BJ085DRAFT_19527 [Dimargaris cristalligena]|eukprot:RKP38946.1 hypothetical protein BJ085DRAFT_19527 [Dimargaris cristalligena]